MFSGLSYQTDDHSLKEAFSGFGEVVEGNNDPVNYKWMFLISLESLNRLSVLSLNFIYFYIS